MTSYHPDVLQALFSSVAERAGAQLQIALHSPGSATEKAIRGEKYAYWRVYLASGKRHEAYLGPVGEASTRAALETRMQESADMRSLARDVQVLRGAGFASADNSTGLTLATLFNAGVFRHGGVLVGSHAFGVLVNALGCRLAANYRTEDIDIGSAGSISIAIRPKRSFLDVLHDSGLSFVEVPELDVRRPATSFKARGRALKVDLLVPGSEKYEVKPLPELKAHATGLPYFGYLVEEASTGVVLSKEHVIPVMVPNPARFALHKLIVSTLRSPANALKTDKDLQQAAALVEALTEKFPAWLSAGTDALEPRARARVARAAPRAVRLAPRLSERARDFLLDMGR